MLLLKIEKECLRKCSKFFKKELFTYLRRERQLQEDLCDSQLEISTLSSVLGVESSAEIVRNYLALLFCHKHTIQLLHIYYSFMIYALK
jgi:hypothetical protein